MFVFLFELHFTMVEKTSYFVVSIILITLIYASMQYDQMNNINLAGLELNINSITRKSSSNFSMSNLADISKKGKTGKTRLKVHIVFMIMEFKEIK